MLVIKNNLIYKIARKIIDSFQIVGLKLRLKDIHMVACKYLLYLNNEIGNLCDSVSGTHRISYKSDILCQDYHVLSEEITF